MVQSCLNTMIAERVIHFDLDDGRKATANYGAWDNDRDIKFWSVDVTGEPKRYYVEGVPTEGMKSSEVIEALKRMIQDDVNKWRASQHHVGSSAKVIQP